MAVDGALGAGPEGPFFFWRLIPRPTTPARERAGGPEWNGRGFYRRPAVQDAFRAFAHLPNSRRFGVPGQCEAPSSFDFLDFL